MAVGIWVLLAKTKLGYELRATGCNKYAAQYCGMKEKRNIILTMAKMCIRDRYCNAAEAGKRALAICTISDSLVTGEELPAADRQTTFTQMMEVALGVAVEMAKR